MANVISGEITVATSENAAYARTNARIDEIVSLAEVIPETTTAWLTEHVSPVGSAVVVDNSLSISGAAADAKVTGSRIDNAIASIEHYPFAETPSNTATYALINLKILSTIYDDIYIAGIVKNNGANGVYAIVLKAADGTQINILNTVASQYTEVAPETAVHFSVNGVEGYYNIDWSKIESGTAAYNSNNNWKGAKINSLCMPNRLVTDTTLAKAGLSADSKTVGDSLNAMSDSLSAMSDSIGDVKSLFTHYPFAEIPSNQYTYALINLKITSSTSNEIYIFRVARQATISGNTVHGITLINGSGEQIHVLNVLSSQYTEVSPDTPVYFSKSGVEGYYNIDWDAIPVGTNAYNTNNNWKGAKINSLCMPNRLVTDTTLSKVGLPADSKTVGDSLSTLSKEVSSDRFILPSVVYGVVGKPFSVYYYNIFKIDSLDGYHVVVSPSSAEVENMGDRVRFACTAAASYTVNFSIRKNDNISLASKTITVTILPDTARSIKAIFIGDSFINDGRMVAELKYELGNYMTLYGTRTKTADNSSGESITVYHEGRSGWSLNDYLTKSEKGGVQNAFWDGNSFNFGYYISQHNDFSDVTDVFILSGPNDYAATPDVYGQRYAQIIASIRTYSQSIKIHCLMPLTCVCSGYAWGVRNHNSAETFRYFMMDYGNEILDLVSNYSDVFAVPMYVYFDRNYNFPTTQVAVNDRTPTLVTVFNDNVHPNGYGYYSMSDMIYADILATGQGD